MVPFLGHWVQACKQNSYSEKDKNRTSGLTIPPYKMWRWWKELVDAYRPTILKGYFFLGTQSFCRFFSQDPTFYSYKMVAPSPWGEFQRGSKGYSSVVLGFLSWRPPMMPCAEVHSMRRAEEPAWWWCGNLSVTTREKQELSTTLDTRCLILRGKNNEKIDEHNILLELQVKVPLQFLAVSTVSIVGGHNHMWEIICELRLVDFYLT